jgi:O-antigen ligase
MSFLYDNVAVLMAAVLTCAFAWLFGGTISDALIPTIPWLTVFLVDVLICFPERRAGESLYSARSRTWRNIKKDPITWLSLAFLILLVIPLFNKGLCPICDYAAIKFENAKAEPLLKGFPYCLDLKHHFGVLMWFVPSLILLVTVKHALLKRGKRKFLFFVVLSGIGLSVLGVIQQVAGAKYPLWHNIGQAGAGQYFFSSFGYANMGGCYFTFLFAISMALWRWNVDSAYAEEILADGGKSSSLPKHKAFWRKHLMLVPSVAFFLSAYATLSRGAIILVSSLAVIMLVHSFFCEFVRLRAVQRLKMAFFCVPAIIAIVLGAIQMTPDSVSKEVDTIETHAALDRVTGRNVVHTRVAIELWKENLFFGCGGWGFGHLAKTKLGNNEKDLLSYSGSINVHNDYLQFMVEHGTVGFLLLVSIVILILKPVFSIWKKQAAAIKFRPAKLPIPVPNSIFIFPAGALFILLGIGSTLVHAFFDCPLRSPAILALFFTSLAAIEGFLPTIKND